MMFKVSCYTSILLSYGHRNVWRSVSVNVSLCPCSHSLSAYSYIKSNKHSSLIDKTSGDEYSDRESREAIFIQFLSDKFTFTTKEVHSMIIKCPDLVRDPVGAICDTAKYLKTLKLAKDTLLNHPWILLFTPNLLTNRLSYTDNLHLDINVSAPLLQIPIPKLKELSYIAGKDASVIPDGNRINFLAKELMCKPVEISQTAAKHSFILSLPFERLVTVLNLLKDAEVTSQAIFKDVWVFRYNIQIIEDRLRQAKEAGIKEVKPWVVRCPVATFERTIERYVSSRELLGSHTSVVSYLCQRLECSPEMIEFLSQKTPQMLKVNVPKLKEVLDFLYEEGFTPQHVCQVPRVINHSLETLQTRLEQLRNIGYNPSSLIVLCQSKRQYAGFIQKLTSKSIVYAQSR